MMEERLHVSEVVSQVYTNSNCTRAVSLVRPFLPNMESYGNNIQSPCSVSIEFSVNHRLRLDAVKLMRQLNTRELDLPFYAEKVHVTVLTMLGKVVCQADYSTRQMEFGPGIFEVKFSRHTNLFEGKIYTINIEFLSSGNYQSPSRSSTAMFEGIFAKFNSLSPGKGLLHSLVCKRE
jgi:hypothetical protein